MATIKADQLGMGGVSLVAFLDLIAWSEGTSISDVTKNDGYDVIVTGESGPNSFSDYSQHPFESGRPPIVVRSEKRLLSSASGRYQIIISTWRTLKMQLNLEDFSPLSQDKAALKLITQAGAWAELAAGQIEAAIADCSKTWASLPGNSYGQGGKTMQELLDKFGDLLGA